ncbi:hypothetical protein [Streptomyces sp. cmx-4-9]
MWHQQTELSETLARGAAPSSPPFWLIALVVVAIVGGAFLFTRLRRR